MIVRLASFFTNRKIELFGNVVVLDLTGPFVLSLYMKITFPYVNSSMNNRHAIEFKEQKTVGVSDFLIIRNPLTRRMEELSTS